jgi:hypothetical protein
MAIHRALLRAWLPGVAGVAAAWATLSSGRVQAADLRGLGSPWVEETDGPETLQTQSVFLAADGGRPFPQLLQFEIGFSTTEVASIGVLYDSLTLSLSRPDGSGSVILATGDVFGLTLSPGGVGSLIPGGSVRVSEVRFRESALPGATTTFAYAVEVDVPALAQSDDFRATFDLFGNGDLQVSRVYAMAVPEPGTLALLGAGALLLGWTHNRRNRA